MFRVCPGLKSLDLYGVVKPGTDLSVLLQLHKSCRTLAVAGEAFTDAAGPVLGKLTMLTELTWQDTPRMTDAGEHLTSLTKLRQLDVINCPDLSAALLGSDYDRKSICLEACSQSPDDSASDSDNEGSDAESCEGGQEEPVWCQLLAMCERSPACVFTQFRKKQLDTEALYEEVDKLKQQLACTKAQLKKQQQLQQQQQQQKQKTGAARGRSSSRHEHSSSCQKLGRASAGSEQPTYAG